MTARVIKESYEGGSIAVDVETSQDRPLVSVATYDPGVESGSAILWLTRDEADALIDALIAANQEIDVAALTERTARMQAAAKQATS